MASSLKPLGKYFLIRYMTDPDLVLEVKDGSKAVDAHVVVGDFQMLFNDSFDHQLWYIDTFAQTLCNKLTGFALHCNDDKIMVVQPVNQKEGHQQWQLDTTSIRLQSQPDQTVCVTDQVAGNGTECRSSAGSENNKWMIDRQPPSYLYITSACNPELVVDVRGANRKPGAKVILYANKGDLADNQLWYEDDNNILRSKLNGFAMDTSGKEVVLSPYDPHLPDHQWVLCGDFIRNVVQPYLYISFKNASFLSSPSLFADNISVNSLDSDHRQWKFNYVLHNQASSLNHTGCGKFFNIFSHSGRGLVMNVDGKVIEPGSNVVMSVCERNSQKHQFYLDDDTGTLRSILRNYCIDLDSGGYVVINPFDPHKKSQRWTVSGKKIVSRHDPNLVLQMETTTDSLGSRVTTGQYDGNDRQHWELRYVPARCFFVVSKMNGKVLDVKGDESSAGAAVIIFDRKSPPCLNQLWYEDENSLLRSKLNGYVIDTKNGEAVVRPYDSSVKEQYWNIVGDRIQNKWEPNHVLDVYGNSSLSTKVGQFKFHGGENQRWKFEMA